MSLQLNIIGRIGFANQEWSELLHSKFDRIKSEKILNDGQDRSRMLMSRWFATFSLCVACEYLGLLFSAFDSFSRYSFGLGIDSGFLTCLGFHDVMTFVTAFKSASIHASISWTGMTQQDLLPISVAGNKSPVIRRRNSITSSPSESTQTIKNFEPSLAKVSMSRRPLTNTAPLLLYPFVLI